MGEGETNRSGSKATRTAPKAHSAALGTARVEGSGVWRGDEQAREGCECTRWTAGEGEGGWHPWCLWLMDWGRHLADLLSSASPCTRADASPSSHTHCTRINHTAISARTHCLLLHIHTIAHSTRASSIQRCSQSSLAPSRPSTSCVALLIAPRPLHRRTHSREQGECAPSVAPLPSPPPSCESRPWRRR